MPFQFAALAMTAAALAAPVQNTFALISAFHDPVLRADLQLKEQLTPARLAQELDAALSRADEELASSFVELADARGLPVSEGQRRRLGELKAQGAQKAAGDFIAGFAGRADAYSAAAMTGAIAADLSGYGDVRDLASEGRKWLDGEEPDHLLVGLSAAGLAVTAATWGSLGVAAPVRGGLSLTKSLHKAGRLSKPLTAAIARSAAQALDREALQATLAAARRLEFGAVRQAGARLIRPDAAAEFRTLGRNVSTIHAKAGARGAQEVLSVAENGAEIGQAARLAAAKGSKTRAIVKVLGRGVLIAGSLTWTLAGWIFAFIGYLFAAASFSRRLGEGIGRLVWRTGCRRNRAAPMLLQAPPQVG